jgi:uncharacterized protein YbjQ (UPF0145 family)
VPQVNRFLLIPALLVASASTAHAQKTATPSVTVVQAGADRLLDDIEYMLKLTNANDQKQIKVLKEFFNDIFLKGVDSKRPVRIDVILGDGDIRYRPHFPISSLKDFRDNLDNFGIESRKKTASLYQLKKAFVGWMRYRNKYASIGEEKNDVPLSIANPALSIKPLLAAGYDLAVNLVNGKTTDKDQAARRKAFRDGLRKEYLAAVKQKKDETDENFAVRKMLTDQQLVELERYYVESATATLGWTSDAKAGEGRLDLKLEPIAKTSLAQSVTLLGQASSHFANVPQSKDAIFALRLNHPLDQLRTKHFKDLFALLRKTADAKIDVSKKRDKDQKTNGKKAASLIFDMLDASVKAGLADGFLEVRRQQTGKHTLVCGLKAVNGKQADAIVALLDKAGPGRTVKQNVGNVAGVVIHSVMLPMDKPEQVKDFFGQDIAIYVGTAKDAVWVAIGENAVAEMSAAATLVAQPNTGKAGAPFVDLLVKVGPWVDLIQKLRPVEAKAKIQQVSQKTDDDTKIEIDRGELRKMALEAFSFGDDVVTMQLVRAGDNVEGHLKAQPGILRLVGKLVAKFSRENVDEEADGGKK